MSYHLDITATAGRAPSLAAFCDAMARPGLRGLPDHAGESWPEDGLSLDVEGSSTRDTSVEWDGERCRVTVRVLAAPVDVALALRATETLANLVGAHTVDTEHFGELNVGELGRHHDAAWIAGQARSGTSTLTAMIRDGRGPMGMPGPRRTTWIGTRLLDELERGGPADALPTRVLETLRRVQWDVPANYRDAGVFAARDPAGERTTLAVWLHDEDLLIPRVHRVALHVGPKDIVVVPFAAVAELAGPRATLLDECQLLIPAISDAEWADTVAAARRLTTP